MKDEFKCEVSSRTKLEAYIGRRDKDVFIEIAIEDVLDGSASICLGSEDARELARTLDDLAQRLQNHLEKAEKAGGDEQPVDLGSPPPGRRFCRLLARPALPLISCWGPPRKRLIETAARPRRHLSHPFGCI
ncbi:MAG: hypothetical protein AAFV29_03680 [Myxococcota bacterium]